MKLLRTTQNVITGGLVVALAASAQFACSSPSDCEATRTCAPSNSDGQGGNSPGLTGGAANSGSGGNIAAGGSGAGTGGGTSPINGGAAGTSSAGTGGNDSDAGAGGTEVAGNGGSGGSEPEAPACRRGCFCNEGVCDRVEEVSPGHTHTCARMKSGKVWCWGTNTQGQLGNESVKNSFYPTLAKIEGASDIDTGISFSCAVLADATVACWGTNASGELGNPKADATAASPVQVVDKEGEPLKGVTQVEAGHKFACARTMDGSVWCWGLASRAGGSGAGVFEYATLKTDVSGTTEIALGTDHSCARRGAFQVYSWGANYSGQIGSGTGDASSARSVGDFSRVFAGAASSCGLDRPGKLMCWGQNTSSSIIVKSAEEKVTKPVVIDYFETDAVQQVSLTQDAACARTKDGTLYCWGSSYGVGNGKVETQPIWPPHQTLTDVRDVQSLTVTVCAVVGDWEVRCWGRNVEGQAGIGSNTTSQLLEPTLVLPPQP